ncbi:hypothetical protein [uncultured Lactococcus sp.]|uniref:hypothetical protein n=1 Tax=uncultured Lactococcus sp. TaxID=167973 RepID=UPI002048DA42|nr:hypothetical protein [uncultured Lactococcus sp.]DAK67089.1 MAG TPA: hypothetical protein [Caudoviricetes sp.]
MEANLIQKVKQSKFKYYLMPLILLILSGIFFTLSHLEVVNSPNTNSGDVGFGYAASGIISLILAVILSIILSAIFIFRKK